MSGTASPLRYHNYWRDGRLREGGGGDQGRDDNNINNNNNKAGNWLGKRFHTSGYV